MLNTNSYITRIFTYLVTSFFDDNNISDNHKNTCHSLLISNIAVNYSTYYSFRLKILIVVTYP